ncbi:MAG: diguanylate cyclase [Nitrospinae bacterium]|nr:diguanylate cyclase [Nitrospinota bacterium]
MPDNENTMIRRVLVIDDNKNIFDDFQTVLQGAADALDLDVLNAELFGGEVKNAAPGITYQLDYASQGKEGYEKIKQALKQKQPYQLAFVDMRMPPGWDGLETIESIWQVDSHIQIVICTAYSDHSWEEITERLGPTDNLLVLKKPFDVTEVAQLASALTEKWHLARKASLRMEQLEELVKERTAELVDAIERLEREITERKQVEQKLEVLATTDALTKLYNRAYFTSKLEEEFQRAERYKASLSLMLIDIDHFKAVNDTYGHQAGDAYLEAFARLVARSVRQVDTVARYGGEELAIILPNTDLDETMALAQRLREEVEALDVPFGGRVIRSTVSIGVALYPEGSAMTAEAFLSEADHALYAMKEAGRNGVFYFARA